MKCFYTKSISEFSHTRWEAPAAAAMILISLLLFYVGLPLWAVVIIQIIGSYILCLFLKVAFIRGGSSI